MIIGTSANAQISIGTGTTVGPLPISTYDNYTYSQQIYSKNEINASMGGDITGVKFYAKPGDPFSNSSSWKVYISHTTKSSFNSTTDWIRLTKMTLVFDGTVTKNNGEVLVTFTTPFPYNNNDNLVIAVDENSPNDDTNFGSFYRFQGTTSNSIYKSDISNPNPATPPTATNITSAKSLITLLGLTTANLSVSNTASSGKNIKIYPNPVNDIVNISDISKVKNISIFDFAGRLVRSFDKPASDVNIKELQSGMYTLILNMNNGSKQTIKINKK